MKYLIKPLLFVIKTILQILLAILLTIVWSIPTLIIVILYPIGYFLWNFKLKFYELNNGWDSFTSDGLTRCFLWAIKYNNNYSHRNEIVKYKTYFHRIWNLDKDSNSKLYNFLNKIR